MYPLHYLYDILKDALCMPGTLLAYLLSGALGAGFHGPPFPQAVPMSSAGCPLPLSICMLPRGSMACAIHRTY
ncbi:hypothetical protein H4582DRAFT_1958114 [Lactarius indigo]|nr:hypothetical protein H4582DRAFT_1958114 [Lactarius indigo]